MSNYRMFAVATLFLSNVLFGQYNPDNHVVTVVIYDLKYLNEVEEGSAEERKELFETYYKKMNDASDRMISSLVLGHYMGGSSNQVKQISEWKSLADADAWVTSGAERRKKMFPKEDERKAFFEKYSKYWVGNHNDLAVRELVANRVKRYKKNVDENTIVNIQTINLTPMSEVEDGTSKEREEVLDEYFKKAVMKNDKVLSHRELRHYWSGSAGGGVYYYVQVREYKSLEDMNKPGWADVHKKAWPNEKKREEFFEKAGKYFAPGHTDLGTHWNWVNLSKR